MRWLRSLTGVAVAGMAVPPGFPKRKPLVIRVSGWLALVFTLITVLCFYVFAEGGSSTPAAVATAFFGSLAFLLLLVWAVPSVLLWWMRYKAEALLSMAGPLAEAAASAVRQRVGASSAPDIKDSAGMWVPTCNRCGQPALFHCGQHQMSLCWSCLQTHDTDQCVYVRAGRVVPPEMQERGR